MAVSLLVFAPSVEEAIVSDLGTSLLEGLGTAVATEGTYGIERRGGAAWIQGLPELISGLDLNHYWAVIRVGLEGGATWAIGRASVRALDLAVEWALKHRQGEKRVRIKLYGPDAKIIKEIDA
jgi:hypothetical protein